MSFDIGKNVSKNGITKKDFMDSNFAKKLDKKEQEQLANIFDEFNTNKDGESKDILDVEEQEVMLAWFKNIGGKDNKVSRSELSDIKKEGTKYKDYKNFMKNYAELTQNGEIEATFHGRGNVYFHQKDDTTYYENGNKTQRIFDTDLGDNRKLTTTENKQGFITSIKLIQNDNVLSTTTYEYANNARKNDKPVKVKVKENSEQTVYTYNAEKDMYTSDNGQTFYNLDKNGLLTQEKAQVKPETAKYDQTKINPQKPAQIKKTDTPEQWQNQGLDGNILKNIGIKEDFHADKVLDKIIKGYGINPDEVQMDKLKADLIKFNPSVFNEEGYVYNGVIWGDLNFPKNAGELYKIGTTTPTANNSQNPSASAADPASAAKATVKTPKKPAPAKVNKNTPIQNQQSQSIPQDATTNLPTKAKPVPEWQQSFSGALTIGTDFRTGANLNGTPLPNVPLSKEEYDNGSFIYTQKINGKTYYYDNNQFLTRVDNSDGNSILLIPRDDSGIINGPIIEEEYDSGTRMLTSIVWRNQDGHVTKYDTYEYQIINEDYCVSRIVNRKADGNMSSSGYTDYERDNKGKITRYIKRSANGKVQNYHDYNK